MHGSACAISSIWPKRFLASVAVIAAMVDLLSLIQLK